MALSVVRNLDLYIVYNAQNQFTLNYGKILSPEGTLVYYDPISNLVTLSNSQEKATNATVIGYPYPTFLENVPEVDCKKILTKPSREGKFITSLRTISNESGLELIIDIQEQKDNVSKIKDHFSIKIGDQFDYDLLKAENKK